MARHQRDRMLLAMAEAVAEVGYTRVSVADVIAKAGVSRATFYEQFADKHDCFLAAYDRAVEHLVGSLTPVLGPGRGEPSFPALLRAYLDALSDNRPFARVFLVDIYSAGPEGLRRRAGSQRLFADLVCDLFRVESPDDRFACEGLVAAISSMVTARVAEGDFDGLRALAEPLSGLADRMLARSRRRRSRPRF